LFRDELQENVTSGTRVTFFLFPENQNCRADSAFYNDEALPNDDPMRDNINKWIEQTLISVQQKYFTNVNEKNRDILYLYRLLTIKYRTVYPLRGKSYNLNDDLKIFLEDKISFALTV
jgi:hypothetical protein